VPPAPYPPKIPARYGNAFWYGTPDLWTMLTTDGVWSGLPGSDAGYSQKIFWWREGYSMYAEPTPDLSVTGRRLDAAAAAPTMLRDAPATNASADFGQGMLTGITIPSLGCWEVTGHYRGHQLSFVVLVEP
jgi:hypothetical protein